MTETKDKSQMSYPINELTPIAKYYIMTQEEFDKAPLLDQILYDTTGMLVKNHSDIAEAMEKYHHSQIRDELISYTKYVFSDDTTMDDLDMIDEYLETKK